MPSLQDLINKFELAASGLREHVETNVILTANDGIALVVERLTETGKDEHGSGFKDYTPAYKKAKTKRKRYKGFVDFQDTGRMLANLKVIGKETQSGLVRVSVGNTGEDNKIKNAANVQTRGNFMTFSQQELRELNADFNVRVENFLKEIFEP